MIEKFRRHWSFVVTDHKYLFPFAAIIILIGTSLSLFFQDPEHMNRVGNFIIGIGVWMNMRFTLREGINRRKNLHDNLPVIPTKTKAQPLNSRYFNNITFSIGDAHFQLYGFLLVIIGSILSSYGDMILCVFVNFCS